MFFTARCYAERGNAMLRKVICPSVTLTRLGYRDHIGWNSSKIISRLVSLGCSLLQAQTSRMTYSKGNTRNFRPNRGGVWKKWLSAHKSYISETRQDMIKVAIEIWGPIGNLICAFDWCQNQWSWMTLRVIMHSVRLSELTTKIWMKINLHIERRRCSPMTLVSGMSTGFLGEVTSNDSSWVIENIDFHGFWRYVFSRLRNEANVIIYYHLIPCRLSITDPKLYDREWPWMAWMVLFSLQYCVCFWVIISYLK